MGQGNLEQRILNSNMNCTDHRAEVSSIDNAGASIISVGSQARQATSIRFAIIEHILEHDSGHVYPIFLALILSLDMAKLKQFAKATQY